MSQASARTAITRWLLLVLILALAITIGGCSKDSPSTRSDDGANRGEEPAEASEPDEPADPQYSSWQVYINDDDSYEKDGITYSIALNLTATNPSGNPEGTYKGTATAKTDSVGEYRGQTLNASAIAKSSRLEFTLEDPTAGGALAPLDGGEAATLSGGGTIAMQASGSGTYGQAGGSFGNNSAQPVEVSVNGSDVTFSVVIDGHKYTFTGTLSGT